MEKSQAIAILNSRIKCSVADKFTVKVSNCSDFNKTLENGTKIVAIANFAAMTPYHMDQAKEQILAGELDKALNNNLSLSIREGDFRPSKGEMVDIEVGYVTNKDGIDVLLVTSMSKRTAVKASKVDFSSFLDDVEVIETEEETTEATGDLS